MKTIGFISTVNFWLMYGLLGMMLLGFGYWSKLLVWRIKFQSQLKKEGGVFSQRQHQKALIRFAFVGVVFASASLIFANNMFNRFNAIAIKDGNIELRSFWPKLPAIIKPKDFVRLEWDFDRKGTGVLAVICKDSTFKSIAFNRFTNTNQVSYFFDAWKNESTKTEKKE